VLKKTKKSMEHININVVKRIAFVVHPDKKTELIEWSYFNKELLSQHEIIASGEAANVLQGTLHKPVHQFVTSPNGGYQELCSLINEDKVDAVIFFRGAEETPMQKKAVKAVMHAALEADIIIANNKITADFILSSPLMQQEITPDDDCYNFQPEQDEHLKKSTAA
jgi:methylglyoxal synthase